MKRLMSALLICAVVAIACSLTPGVPYEDSIKTAIVMTQTAFPTATPTITPTFTPEPTATPAPTDTPLPSPTSEPVDQGASMNDLLQKLLTDKVLDKIEGTYTKLPDVEKDTNQTGIFISVSTGSQPKNYVLRTDVSWEVDGGQADWNMTGPAFFVHQNGTNYIALHTALGGGFSKLIRSVNGVLGRLSKGPTSNLPTPSGKSQMVLVVNKTLVKMYADGKDYFTANYAGLVSEGWNSGELGLGLANGNAKGYGTRVKFSNIELWTLNE